ncbi:MAG: quinolinate synthase NadA [Planctomycetota bacterium]
MPTLTDTEYAQETDRLLSAMSKVGWSRELCELHAPLTLEIERLKREQDAVVLAHSYQVPEICYGVADFRGDSLALAQFGRTAKASKIVLAGVRFMAETAKILSPEKTVLHPASDAGCSLSESITAEDVRRLRAQHPGRPVVCYVNTSAAVKAEVDVCCTSANAMQIINALPDQEIVFIPDALMAQNLQKLTTKRLIPWNGKCIVHESFSGEKLAAHRASFPDARIMVHTECAPEVVGMADLAGGTSDMMRYVRESGAKRFMVITECGLADRMRIEFPDREFVGACSLCPYMKRVDLANIRQVLTAPRPDQVVEIEESVRVRAERSLTRMLEIGASRD